MSFLLVDNIIELASHGVARGIKHITATDPVVCIQGNQHYFISAFIGEALGQLAAWYVMFSLHFQKRPVAGIVQSATVYRPVFLGEILSLTATIDRLDEVAVEYHAQATCQQKIVFTLEGALGPLLPMDTFIDDEVVRQQFAMIYQAQQDNTQPLIISDHVPLEVSHWFDFDTIYRETPHSIRAEKYITVSHAPYFADHFPKKPVLPLTVLLESLARLAGILLQEAHLFGFVLYQIKHIKMKDFIQPGDTIQSMVELKTQTATMIHFFSRTFLKDKRICTLELVFRREAT